MATTTITVRTDESIKRQAQELFEALGLDMSAAINVFLRAAIKEGAIPFILRKEPNLEYLTYIKANLDERVQMMDAPDAVWYSTDTTREMLGL